MVILPTKHTRTGRSLLGVGARILTTLKNPMTVSALWDRIRDLETGEPSAAITYRWFVLSLDLLYLMGAVEYHRGVLRRTT